MSFSIIYSLLPLVHSGSRDRLGGAQVSTQNSAQDMSTNRLFLKNIFDRKLILVNPGKMTMNFLGQK